MGQRALTLRRGALPHSRVYPQSASRLRNEICMFAVFVLNNNVRGNGLTEIVQNQSCIDFLLNELHLF